MLSNCCRRSRHHWQFYWWRYFFSSDGIFSKVTVFIWNWLVTAFFKSVSEKIQSQWKSTAVHPNLMRHMSNVSTCWQIGCENTETVFLTSVTVFFSLIHKYRWYWNTVEILSRCRRNDSIYVAGILTTFFHETETVFFFISIFPCVFH